MFLFFSHLLFNFFLFYFKEKIQKKIQKRRNENEENIQSLGKKLVKME
jgi:hypothetical protein